MRKLFVLAVMATAVLALWASPQGGQANAPAPDWNVAGIWTGCSGLVGNCAYPFSMTLSQDSTGAVSGTIVYTTGQSGAITGQVSGSEFVFLRTDPSTYWATCDDCAIATDGLSFSGTGVDSPGRAVEWQAQGVARHLPTMSIDDCSPGAYAGWGHIWTGFVSSAGTGSTTPVVTSPALAAGRTYRIGASGTFYAGGASQFDIEADAEYSQDTYQRVNGLGWTDSVRNYEGYGEGLLELKVDGGFVEWGGGAFSSDHRYTLDETGSGDPVTFDLQIYDIYAQNNTGGLCVAIYEPYSLHWLPPISLDDWTLNEKATLPIKFQLDDPNTSEIICTDLSPTLTVNSALQDLRFDADACHYIANFRPSSTGTHQAEVALNSVQLGSKDFDVREAGTPNGRGKSNS